MTFDSSRYETAERRSETSDREVARLFGRLRIHGDQAAREELILRFMPLARSVAARYRGPQTPFEDLVQVAVVGLIGAVDRFDPGRGHRFSSFAVPTMIGELKRFFRNTAWAVHVPRRAQELSMRVQRATRELAERDGRQPTVRALAEHLSLDLEFVISGLQTAGAHRVASLDAPAAVSRDGDDREPLIAAIGHEDEGFERIDTRLALESAIARLPLGERAVLRLRMREQLKQTEIAERLGISQMQVSRRLRRAAEGLRRVEAIG